MTTTGHRHSPHNSATDPTCCSLRPRGGSSGPLIATVLVPGVAVLLQVTGAHVRIRGKGLLRVTTLLVLLRLLLVLGALDEDAKLLHIIDNEIKTRKISLRTTWCTKGTNDGSELVQSPWSMATNRTHGRTSQMQRTTRRTPSVTAKPETYLSQSLQLLQMFSGTGTRRLVVGLKKLGGVLVHGRHTVTQLRRLTEKWAVQREGGTTTSKSNEGQQTCPTSVRNYPVTFRRHSHDITTTPPDHL